MTFQEFAAKHQLTDAKLVERSVFISLADYWRWANRAAASLCRATDELGGMNGFLSDGYQIYLDNEVAGTGLTVETDIDAATYLRRLE